MSSTPVPGLHARVELVRGSFTLDVDLVVPPGQVVSVLGPNGAGKSTLLAALAGLLPIGSGRIELDGVVYDDPAAGVFRRPEHRPVGVVFQDYRLFPNLSAAANVAFGPRARGVSRAAALQRAGEWLERLGVGVLADRRPEHLSGGQAQRVALARALATGPTLLLLDEPLAALDAQTRREVQQTLRDHLDEFAGPVVIVTHDPIDAIVLADRLVVLEGGRVIQDAAPDVVASAPAGRYVAELLDLNMFRGAVAGGRLQVEGGGELVVTGIADAPAALAVVRPSAVTVHRDRPQALSARNIWPGRIRSLTRLPDRVRVAVDATPPVIADVTSAAVDELELAPGTQVWLSVKATDVSAYPASPGPEPQVRKSGESAASA